MTKKEAQHKKYLRLKFKDWLFRHYRKKRVFIFIFSAIVLSAIYLFKDASFLLRAVSAISFLGLFYVTDHYLDLRFKWYHYIFVLIIAVASFLLSPLYYIHPQYDKVQHFIQPIFVSSIVFYLISKLDIPKRWKIIFAAFTVISILTLFEIGEYSLDRLFDWKLQGVYLRDKAGFEKLNLLLDPLDDTIYDLIFGTLGTGLYGIFKFWQLRKTE